MKLEINTVRTWLDLCRQKWQSVAHRSAITVAAVSALVFLTAMLIYLVLVPVVSALIITKLRELRNGTWILDQWFHQPIPLLTKVYLWNLTNPQNVASGLSTPLFRQVGPYVYEQRTEKTPIEFKKNSIVYLSRTVYQFRADLTEPASLDDSVVTLHAALYGTAMMVKRAAPSMVPMVDKAVPYLFPGVDSIFVPVRVGSYLFDGILLNCSTTGSATAQMVCANLPKFAPPTIQRKQNTSDFVYSFLAHKNNTVQGPYEEDRGMEDIRHVGSLLRRHNSSELGVWQKNSSCDRLHGTDSLTLPPFTSRTDRIDIYIPDVCQVVPLGFEGVDYIEGLSVFKFRLSDNWLAGDQDYPDNSCYCSNKKQAQAQFCNDNGLRDLTACMKVPVVMSLPHFYQADARFSRYAQGMHPDPDLHSSVLYIEPQTGTPVKAARRVQFNMFLHRIKGFNLVKNVTEGLFPLIWLEETAQLTDEDLRPAKQPLLIQWGINVFCLFVMAVTLLVTCASLVVFLYLSRACCFRHVANNQVTSLYSKTTPESASVLTLALPLKLYPRTSQHSDASCT